jgi:hypothetical protein
MTTALPIDDEVMRRLQEEAARRGSTPAELVEEALRRMLEHRREGSVMAELPTFRGGVPFVDVSDREALFRAMEGT